MIDVEKNLNLVHYVLQKYIKPDSQHYEDYFQEGCVWLCKAAKNFNESKGFAFSTFAVPYIIGGLKKYTREANSLGGIHFSRGMLDNFANVKTTAEKYSLDLSSIDDIEAACHIAGVKNFSPISVMSLQSIINAEDDKDSDITLESLIADKEDPYEECLLNETFSGFLQYCNGRMSKITYAMLADLLEHYQQTGEILTQKMLAVKYNRSQTTVSRMQKRAGELWAKFTA